MTDEMIQAFELICDSVTHLVYVNRTFSLTDSECYKNTRNRKRDLCLQHYEEWNRSPLRGSCQDAWVAQWSGNGLDARIRGGRESKQWVYKFTRSYIKFILKFENASRYRNVLTLKKKLWFGIKHTMLDLN